MAIVGSKVYTKIITLGGGEIYDVFPFDSFGNALNEVIIEIDSTLGSPTINLPTISSFNQVYNTSITIVGNTGLTNVVGIKAFSGETIGGQSDVFLDNDYKAVKLTIATENTWYGVVTA